MSHEESCTVLREGGLLLITPRTLASFSVIHQRNFLLDLDDGKAVFLSYAFIIFQSGLSTTFVSILSSKEGQSARGRS